MLNKSAGLALLQIGRRLPKFGPFLQPAQESLMRQTQFGSRPADAAFTLQGLGNQIVFLLVNHA